VQEALKEGARQVGQGAGHRRLRQGLVVAEIALAVVLLAGAGLMLRSLSTLRRVDIGIDTRNVLTARVQLPTRKYDTPRKRLQCFEAAVRRAAALPRVQSSGAISFLPFTGLGAGTDVRIVGDPPPAPGQGFGTDVSVCDNGYFQTMRLPLVRGRLFTER